MIYKAINAFVIIFIVYILIFKLLPTYNTYLQTKKNINIITVKISNVKIVQVKTRKQKNARFNAVIGGTTFKFLSFLRTNGIKYTILKNNQAILTTNYRIIKYLPSYVLIQSVSRNNIKLSY